MVPSFRGQVLAKRQMEALWLLGQGMTRKQVARQLGQSVGGLTATLAVARKRLGAETVEQAAEMGREIIAPYVKWLDLEGRAQREAGNGGQWPRLTPEETRVLQALSEGLKGPQIAERLGKAVNTVYSHLDHMREKFGAGNNRQLLEFAREAGCPSIPSAALASGGVRFREQAGALAPPDAQKSVGAQLDLGQP